jgi:peptidoglycan/LPS O-acetylase OafA/YrhL
MLVVLHHAGIPYADGNLGVEAFFVLSGFLITWRLLQEQDATGRISIWAFYARRFRRIFPAFYGFWLVYVVLAVMVEHRSDWAQYWSSFFYAGNYYYAIMRPTGRMSMAHTWSLAVEEQFYLLWPLLLVWLGRSRRRMIWILGGAIGSVWLYRWGLYACFGRGAMPWMLVAFDARADQLGVGCLLAVLGREWGGAITRFLPSPVAGLSLLAASSWLSQVGSGIYMTLGGFAVEPILVAVLLCHVVARGWLQWRALQFVGRVSYSVYLYHWLVDKVVVSRLSSWPLLDRAVVAIAASLVLGSCSYWVFERGGFKGSTWNVMRGGPRRLPLGVPRGTSPAGRLSLATTGSR